MSRASAVALLCAFKKHAAGATVRTLSKETLLEESSVREWLYALQAAGLVSPSGGFDTVIVNNYGATRQVVRWKLLLD